jgi:Glycosyltransferase 61
LRLGKYLLPVGIPRSGWRWTKAPSQQVGVVQLAADHADWMKLQIPAKAEVLSEYEYACHASGEHESRVLPSEFVPPAFLAELRNGLTFGRHCCVIGPNGKAVRETGFNLDGRVVEDVAPLARFRPRYWRKRWQGDVTSRPWLPPKQRIDGCVAVLNSQFSHNFYHWMCDILPRLMPLRWAGAKPDFYLVDCLTPFQQDVLAALGIRHDQLIQPHCRLLLEADRLLVPSMPTPACLRDFGRFLSSCFGLAENPSSSRRIFISRRKTGKRTVANEKQLEALLRANGFETHSMEDYPLAKQAKLVGESEIIVATHGAGLANLVFARPGTRIIEITPSGRHNATLYPEKSRIFGLHHQVVFAPTSAFRQVLRVNLDDVAAALWRAERPLHRVAAA